ncbi:hypothetical protein AUJ35_02060 [Candidatus Falkowbacteria bacterium CG1_02_41_21]|uniref:PurE domain-containing protein n=1 Tax=Candidatus Falkowbacteria bacterium CG1_02_41_21 TaxID=1805147 RepID=A0A1J4T9F3_9BACT|nr:MAG: hypothetical protein AUJ35_02060 [Candidatus Falkowbacteria bacterium CG1_02_41_21]
MEKRRIVVIVGSKSDLAQCRKGLEFLAGDNRVEVVGVYVRSQHRNTLETQKLLKKLSGQEIDAAIIGAGWANHLSGCCDAYLRYTLKDSKIVVLGVAFEDRENPNHTKAATLSITEVPGTQVVFNWYGDLFIGADGFSRACAFAAMAELWPMIKLPSPKDPMDLTLDEALKLASE